MGSGEHSVTCWAGREFETAWVSSFSLTLRPLQGTSIERSLGTTASFSDRDREWVETDLKSRQLHRSCLYWSQLLRQRAISSWEVQREGTLMKRCSTLLIIREMQIKTTMRYHLTLVRMAITKNSANNKCWTGCEEKGTLLHRWWECKLVQPLWRTVWRFLKKLKIELPYDPAIPLLGMYPEKTLIQKDTCTPMFIAALLTITNEWNQPKCPSTDEWIKKIWHIYTMEYYSAIKRNKLELFVVRWLDLESVIQSEVRKRKPNTVC